MVGEEVMELKVAVERWVTEVAAVKMAKEECKGENQEAAAVNSGEEGMPHWNYLKMYPLSVQTLRPLEESCRMNHLERFFHLWNARIHLPSQVHHPHPPRCSDVYRLKLLSMLQFLLSKGSNLVWPYWCAL